ncbi:PilZ domain-containing protein, partial [bacterium]
MVTTIIQKKTRGDFTERRYEPRFEAKGKVEIILDGEKNTLTADLLNISNRGMAFISSKELREGLCHFLSFSLSAHNEISNIKGKVIRQVQVNNSFIT